MRFKELEQHVPYVVDGVLHERFTWLIEIPREFGSAGNSGSVGNLGPYEFRVGFGQPGKYRHRTAKPGGDLVVVVDDVTAGWETKKFKHGELFHDIELKRDSDAAGTLCLLEDIRSVLYTADPAELGWSRSLPGVHPSALLYACQLLGLAEWRRYAHMEANGGGRNLFFTFLRGIYDRKWSAEEAAEGMREGLRFVRRRDPLNRSVYRS